MFETDLRATLAGSIRTVCFTSIPDIGSRISISDIQSITGIDPRSGIWIDQTTDRDLIYNPQLQGGLIYLRSDLRYRYRFSDIDPSQISIPTDIQRMDVSEALYLRSESRMDVSEALYLRSESRNGHI